MYELFHCINIIHFLKMNYNIIKIAIFVGLFINFTTINSLSFPIPALDPKIIMDKLGDIIKHGKRAIEKNKEDQQKQEEYNKSKKKKEKNISEEEEKNQLIERKEELRKVFDGIWEGQLIIKNDTNLNISCDVKIVIKDSVGTHSSICDNIDLKINLFINLERNLENSYIKMSLQKNRLNLEGDITSFHGRDKKLYVLGGLQKK